MGQLAFAAVGAVVSTAAGAGPAIGWAVGSAIGGVVFAPDGAQTTGPRLEDLKSNVSTYGQPIPRAYGQIGFMGSLIWMEDLKEYENVEEASKGGDPASATTFTYSASFAMLLLGIEGQEVKQLNRIWINEKCYYDIRDETNIAAIQSSHMFSQYFKFYKGTQTQLPDPTIEAVEGVGNVNGYRGRSYCVFTDLPLAFVQNQPPGALRISFEVVLQGAPSTGLRLLKEVANAPGANGTNNLIMPVTENVVRVLQQLPDTFVYVNDLDGVNLSIDDKSEEENQWPVGGTIGGDCAITRLFDGAAMRAHRGILQINDPSQAIYTITEDGGTISALGILPDQTDYIHGIIPSADQQHAFVFVGPMNNAVTKYHLIAWRLTTDEWELVRTSTVNALNNLSPGPFGPSSQGSNGYSGMAESDLRYIWFFTTSGVTGFYLYYVADDFTIDFAEPFLPESSFIASSPSQIWVDNGTAYAFGGDLYYVVTRNDGPANNAQTLQEVHETECSLAGLDIATQVEASALSLITVEGMFIRRLGPTRGVIGALEPAYFYDTVESDGKLKAVLRGGASAVTITEDDLGASITDRAEDELVNPERGDDNSLPGEVIVTYLDRASDYQVAAQHDRRSAVETEQPVNLEMPLVFSPDEARQIGSVWLYNQWAGRTRRTLRLSRKYSYLEPTDVITLRTDIADFTLRIVAVKVSEGMLELECVDEDAALYVQNAEGAPINQGSTIQTPTPTKLVLLDIPMLRESDNDPGFYLAAAGYGANWPGALILRSTDTGVTYTTVASITTGATMGNVSLALPNYTGPLGYDYVNSIVVTLFGSAGTLQSCTDEELLAGANPFALGSPTTGWELGQFKTATLITGNTWRLTQLLRGRRGTEHEMAGHGTFETFILLESSKLRRIGADSPAIGVENHYKAVTFGQQVNNAATQTFTNTAASLKPYSGVNPRASGFGGDITITWTRRGRVYNDWMDGVTLPLGEASESYSIDIYDGATFKRTLTSSTPSVVYSSANQTTDFGAPVSPGDADAHIYQLSAIVGRGFPLIFNIS